jgi:hypothetical protein
LKQTFIMPETTSTYWYYRLQFTGINDGFVEIAELVLYAA